MLLDLAGERAQFIRRPADRGQLQLPAGVLPHHRVVDRTFLLFVMRGLSALCVKVER